MKTSKTLIILSLFIIGLSPLEAKKMKGDDISNLLIEGENRLRVRPTMPDLQWDPTPYRDISEILRDRALVGALKPPALSNPPVPLPKRSRSQKAASPWLDRILEPPVLTLNIHQKMEDQKVNWTLLVKDSQGKVFYQKKKKGVMPQQLKWEGFGKGHKPLKVGYDYSYALLILDEASNPQRFAGDPFKIPAFRYKKGGKWVTSIFPESIFINESSLKFSKSGVRYLIEVKDSLRNSFGKTINVVTYDRDTRFAKARSNKIRDFLAKVLEYPREKIVTAGLRLSKGDGYRHVDIIAK